MDLAKFTILKRNCVDICISRNENNSTEIVFASHQVSYIGINLAKITIFFSTARRATDVSLSYNLLHKSPF